MNTSLRGAAVALLTLAFATPASADMPATPTAADGLGTLFSEVNKQWGTWSIFGVFVVITICSLYGLWALRQENLRKPAAQQPPHDPPT